MLDAETISNMPSVEITIRTGNSNLSNFSALAKPTDMISVTMEPISVSTFMKRLKLSLTMAPPNAAPFVGKRTTRASAAISTATDNPLTSVVARSPENTPIMSSAKAPTARRTSGAARVR